MRLGLGRPLGASKSAGLSQPLYDLIGHTYVKSRRADPAIAKTIAERLRLRPTGDYLDLACGTGNYTVALNALGGHWTGIDASDVMLAQARQKSTAITWTQSSAEELPFADAAFDGAICTLAIHHFPDLASPFAEVRRTLRSGHFVIFTGLAEQMRQYWLCHYFPEMMARSIEKMPSESQIRVALLRAGFRSATVAPFFVTTELQDLFLYSGKDRPKIYMDADIRANISSFAQLACATELQEGLVRLKSDLQSGAFDKIKAQFAAKVGDYAYIAAPTDG